MVMVIMVLPILCHYNYDHLLDIFMDAILMCFFFENDKKQIICHHFIILKNTEISFQIKTNNN